MSQNSDRRHSARITAPNCVTIFGGGIAGLTAAHELAERGFRVQVWEPAADPRYPQRGCDVGGMARSQWASVPWPDERRMDVFQPAGAKDTRPVGARTHPIVHLPYKLSFTSLAPVVALRMLDEHNEPAIEGTDFSPLLKRTAGTPWIEVSVRGWEQLSSGQRQSFIARNMGLLSETLGDPGRPYFDRSTQTWQSTYAGNGAEFKVTWLGNFVNAAGRNDLPADALAVVTVWDSQEYRRVVFTNDAWRLVMLRDWDPGEVHILGREVGDLDDAVVSQFFEDLMDNPHIDHIYVEACDRDYEHLTDAERMERARKVNSHLIKKLGLDRFVEAPSPSDPPPSRRLRQPLTLITPTGKRRNIRLEIVPLPTFPPGTPDDVHLLLSFRVRERWLPGEHGYRFFPSFYRHVFDTMKRTPILEVDAKSELAIAQERAVDITKPERYRYVETGRTVYDNLQPTSQHVLAFEDGTKSAIFSRSVPKSFRELREYIEVLFGPEGSGGFAISPRESSRFALKLFKYMTSCSERRTTYEGQTWWTYIDGDSYSEQVKKLLDRWPEALVAMDAKTADARSHGTAFVQLLLENLRPSGYRDGTLRGPTSEAWLTHWRRYLEAQGVEFIHGELIGFESLHTADTPRVWPKVRCFDPRVRVDAAGNVPLMPGYFVLCPSANKVGQLAKEFREVCRGAGIAEPSERSDMARAATISAAEVDLREAEPTNDFRHFAGIQFYFAEDILFVDGHVYYPDSPWGLTSISQARFWQDRTDWEHGFRGILSAIIGIWNQPGRLVKKNAWDCTPDELATEVWHQITTSFENSAGRASLVSRFRPETTSGNAKIPQPVYWHLDESLVYAEKEGFTNLSPFHIASPKGFANRPGDPKRGYRVESGWVLCGMFMKTFTRIPTMEAANESARHAVNAILEHSQAESTPGHRHELRGSRCDTWNPEDYEVDDLDWFKELDRELFNRGLDHIVDIFEMDYLMDTVLRGGPDDPFDPINITRRLRQIALDLPKRRSHY